MRVAIVAAGAVGLAFVARLQMQPPEPRIVRRVSPVSAASGAVERGRQVYARYGCAQCHGIDAKGGFPNPNAETASQVPGLLFVKEGYTTEELRRKVLDGVPTVGKGDPKGPTPPYRMPGWAGRMAEADASDLVQYLFSLYPKSAEQSWR